MSTTAMAALTLEKKEVVAVAEAVEVDETPPKDLSRKERVKLMRSHRAEIKLHTQLNSLSFLHLIDVEKDITFYNSLERAISHADYGNTVKAITRMRDDRKVKIREQLNDEIEKRQKTIVKLEALVEKLDYDSE